MKMIYLLAEAGGKGRPDPDEIKSARKSLTKMIAEYTVEFICLMARFKAARKEDLEELLRTPTIKALVGKYRNRIDEQLESLANDDKRRAVDLLLLRSVHKSHSGTSQQLKRSRATIRLEFS